MSGAPAAVVFDNDGLLLDTEEAWTRAERILFARHGGRFTMEHKRSLIGSSREVAARKLEAMLGRAGRGLELMDELHDLVMDEILHDVPPRPGAVELLDLLEAAGTPFALATNSPRAFAERALRTAGLHERFEILIAADEVAEPKPAPDVYLAACGGLGHDPARCVALEDSPSGVAAALAAGMTVVGVPYLDGIVLDAHLVATSLREPVVLEALGLVPSGG